VDTPPPVSTVNPKVPKRLERLIDRLLSKDPDGRPATAEEVVAELRAIERELAGGGSMPVPMPAVVEEAEVVEAVEPLPPKAKKAKWQRHMSMALIAGGILVGLGAVLGVTLLLSKFTNDPAKLPSPTSTPASPTTVARGEQTRPWEVMGPDGRPQWHWYDMEGHPRPLPPDWRPGMPPPPGFQPPPPPRPRD
jgi:hypothetical protein